jgi:hypothetical protein
MTDTKKDIHTLVEDIYSILSNGYEVSDEQAKEFGDNMATLIQTRLKPRTKREPSLRLSGIGKQDYQLWYEMNGYEVDEELPPNVLYKFIFGDIIEELTLTLAKFAGHEVTEQQGEVVVEGVKGHKDARINGVTVDVKSASSFAFNKFKRGTMLTSPTGFDKQYLCQLAAYTQGDSGNGKVDDKAGFLAVDKQNGHICYLEVHDMELPNAAARVKHVKEMIKQPEPPKPEYELVEEKTPSGKLTGNIMLPPEGAYCPYKFQVWPNLRVFGYAKGPVFYTHVEKEPRVPEITDKFNHGSKKQDS